METGQLILVVIALIAFVAAIVPTWPDRYLLAVGGILLAVAMLVGLRA